MEGSGSMSDNVIDLRGEDALLAAEMRILAAMIDTIEVMDYAAQERVLDYMKARLIARRAEDQRTGK